MSHAMLGISTLFTYVLAFLEVQGFRESQWLKVLKRTETLTKSVLMSNIACEILLKSKTLDAEEHHVGNKAVWFEQTGLQ